MAEKKIKEEAKEAVKEAPKTERELVWEDFLADYKAKNPTKYEQKRATTYTEIINGKEVVKAKKDELAVPPDAFIGIIEYQMLPSGKQVKMYR